MRQKDCVGYIMEERMLENAGIPGLAGMSVFERDGRKTYVYRIGGMAPLSDAAAEKGLDREIILRVLKGMKEQYENCGRYFLDPQGLVLDPARIYCGGQQVKFIYIPGNRQDIRTAAEELCLFFFRYTGYEDVELLDILHRTMSMLRSMKPGETPAIIDGAHHYELPESGRRPEKENVTSTSYTLISEAKVPELKEDPAAVPMPAPKDKKSIKGRKERYGADIKSRAVSGLDNLKKKVTGIFSREKNTDFWPVEDTDEIIFNNGIPSFVKEDPDLHVILENVEDRRDVHEVDRFPATIGKKPGESDIIIKDSYVEKRHALLSYDDGAVMVTDLGSVYGTYLNGKKLKKGSAAELKDGDSLGFASLNYRVAFEIAKRQP